MSHKLWTQTSVLSGGDVGRRRKVSAWHDETIMLHNRTTAVQFAPVAVSTSSIDQVVEP